jgi:hypothetical protein
MEIGETQRGSRRDTEQLADALATYGAPVELHLGETLAELTDALGAQAQAL